MEVNGQRHVPAALTREKASVAIEQEVGRFLGPVWSFLEMRSTRIDIRNPVQPGHKFSCFAGYATPAPRYVYVNL